MSLVNQFIVYLDELRDIHQLPIWVEVKALLDFTSLNDLQVRLAEVED